MINELLGLATHLKACAFEEHNRKRLGPLTNRFGLHINIPYVNYELSPFEAGDLVEVTVYPRRVFALNGEWVVMQADVSTPIWPRVRRFVDPCT